MLNIDLQFIISGLSVFFITFLGILVYVGNWKEKNGRFFLFLSFSVAGWAIAVLFRFYSTEIEAIILSARLTFFFAALMVFCLYVFTWHFPIPTKEKVRVFDKIIGLISIVIVVVAGSTYTVKKIDILDGIQDDLYGLGYYLFGVYFWILLILSAYNLLSKYRRLNLTEKTQVQYVLLGFVASMTAGFATNVLLPFVTGVTDLAKLGPAAAFFFIFLTSIAILKHSLFNLKVVATELFILALWVFIFVRTLIAETLSDRIANANLLILTIIVGVFLIRSVLKEVHQREKIEKLAGELENFIHFLSHEVKGILGKNKITFAAMIEGDLGAISPETLPVAKQSYKDTESAIEMVMNILQSSDLKNGKMEIKKGSFDLKAAVLEEIEKFRPETAKKNLGLETEISEGNFTINGDRENIMKHVLWNLLSNALTYTPEGKITVKLSKENNKVIFCVRDTGLGLTDETKARLFTEGGRGENAVKVNVHSTGYGLFFAKGLIDAHNGKIYAESDGQGKGSSFCVELPV